jgi:predicted DsbA family dithiol-disulfide isomerase
MKALQVFGDVLCPFTHVGLCRLRAAREERGASTIVLHVRAWPLEWVNGRPLAADFVAHEVAALREQVAPDLFRGFDANRFPKTSIPALGLAAAAYRLGTDPGERVSFALRRALFEKGLDVSDDGVLAAVAAREGVSMPDPDLAWRLVEEDYAAGRALGVEGSPYFVLPDGAGLFCPTLDIRKDGDQLHVTEDVEASARLIEAALGP